MPNVIISLRWQRAAVALLTGFAAGCGGIDDGSGQRGGVDQASGTASPVNDPVPSTIDWQPSEQPDPEIGMFAWSFPPGDVPTAMARSLPSISGAPFDQPLPAAELDLDVTIAGVNAVEPVADRPPSALVEVELINGSDTAFVEPGDDPNRVRGISVLVDVDAGFAWGHQADSEDSGIDLEYVEPGGSATAYSELYLPDCDEDGAPRCTGPFELYVLYPISFEDDEETYWLYTPPIEVEVPEVFEAASD